MGFQKNRYKNSRQIAKRLSACDYFDDQPIKNCDQYITPFAE